MVGLTSLEIKNAPPGMHADGNGLYLFVKSAGTKSWVFRYQIHGRRREMGLGALKSLEPVKARSEAAQLKARVAAGIDPLDERQQKAEATKQARNLAAMEQKRSETTFRVAAEHLIESRRPSWSNPKHAQQWTNTLATYAYPVIGDLPVADVTAEHIVTILRPIWAVKSETASRVRMRLETVLNAAKLMGWRCEHAAGRYQTISRAKRAGCSICFGRGETQKSSRAKNINLDEGKHPSRAIFFEATLSNWHSTVIVQRLGRIWQRYRICDCCRGTRRQRKIS